MINYIIDRLSRVILGTAGADDITTGEGSNLIQGGDGADRLNGGNDHVRDILVGGAYKAAINHNPGLGHMLDKGADVLEMGVWDLGYGGGGPDVFRFHTAGGPYAAPAWIGDFDAAEGDRIILPHMLGLDVYGIKGRVDGHTLHLEEFAILGHDKGILDGVKVRVQIGNDPDGWGAAHDVAIDFNGPSYWDEVRAWVHSEDFIL